MNAPTPVLKDGALYQCDNGATYHGRCCGSSARFTGRDLSGQEVLPLGKEELLELQLHYGIRATCEDCGGSWEEMP